MKRFEFSQLELSTMEDLAAKNIKSQTKTLNKIKMFIWVELQDGLDQSRWGQRSSHQQSYSLFTLKGLTSNMWHVEALLHSQLIYMGIYIPGELDHPLHLGTWKLKMFTNPKESSFWIMPNRKQKLFLSLLVCCIPQPSMQRGNSTHGVRTQMDSWGKATEILNT